MPSPKMKTLTVLRTKVPLKAEGKSIPPKTRVVVMSLPEPGKVKVKVRDPNHKALDDLRLIVSKGALVAVSRGRPLGSKKVA